jgi:hypothetical protein
MLSKLYKECQTFHSSLAVLFAYIEIYLFHLIPFCVMLAPAEWVYMYSGLIIIVSAEEINLQLFLLLWFAHFE